jgi:hypothetical protein
LPGGSRGLGDVYKRQEMPSALEVYKMQINKQALNALT